jgi:spermidine/putrescine-binding protein
MKKLIIIFTALIAFTIGAFAIISTPKTVLNFLNWGEYIDVELVQKFEQEFNCQVNEEDVTSSEAMYQKISAGTTAYDVAIPGDYVVKQMYEENLLREIDVTNGKYQNLYGLDGNLYKTMFTDSLQELIDNNFVNKDGKVYDSYFMPYFWGAYSIIYNKQNPETEKVVKENGFNAIFDRTLYSSTVKIGAYDTSRWDVAIYLLSQGMNPNLTDPATGSVEGDLSKGLQNDIENAIRQSHFDEWGNDSLKRDTANGTIDLCFTQLGDFFDALYLTYDSGVQDINFNVNVPDNTAAFFDAMVIPTTCKQYDLANEFINFMLDPENAYQNAQAIGYCPTLKDVVTSYETDAMDPESYYYFNEETGISLSTHDFLETYPMYLNPLYGKTSEQIEKIKLFDPKPTAYLTTCESVINRAKN